MCGSQMLDLTPQTPSCQTRMASPGGCSLQVQLSTKTAWRLMSFARRGLRSPRSLLIVEEINRGDEIERLRIGVG